MACLALQAKQVLGPLGPNPSRHLKLALRQRAQRLLKAKGLLLLHSKMSHRCRVFGV